MSRTLLLSIALLVAHGATTGTASTHPWPQFRGPQGDGISPATSVPLSWSATSNVAWKTSVPGLGWSSPVLAHGRIYLLDEQGLGVVVARGREFKKLSENPIGERALASYAVTDGSLVIRSESHLYSIRSQP